MVATRPLYRQTFVRLLGFLKPYKWSLIVSIILAVASQAAALAIAYLTATGLEQAFTEESREDLYMIAALVLAVGAARAIFMAGRRLISGRQALGVEFDMRNALYAKLLRLSFRFYDRHQTGQLLSRATIDLQTVRFFLGYGLIFFFQNVLMVLGATAIMFVVNWRLALVATAVTPLIVVFAYRYSTVSHPVLRDVQQKMADVATVAEENIVGVHVVKSFAQEQNEFQKFADRSERVFERSIDANKQRALYIPLLSFLPLIMQAGVLFVGGRMVAHGTLDIQTFLFFNVLVVMLVMPLRMLGMWVGQSQRATASGERIFEIMDEPEEISDRPDAANAAGRGACALRARLVRVRPRPPGAPRHRPRARARPDGCADRPHGLGKDDARLARPALLRRRREGRITIDGVDVRDVKLQSLRREIGIVSQDPFLFSATVRENISFGAGGRDRRGDRSGGDARPGARVHRRAPRRLRHGHRRARDHALRRPAPAARDRARADHGTAHPDPRRRDRLGGRDDRGEDPTRACARR